MAANMVVRTNVFSLNAHRNMKNVGLEQQRASNRLSSGYRINSAADDAAGLAISETMRAQIRGLDQASRNAQDAQALILTTEGGMQEITNMLQRVRELLVQASNDTNVDVNREQIALEINQLAAEIGSMQARVQFNTRQTLMMGDADVEALRGPVAARAAARELFATAESDLAAAQLAFDNAVAAANATLSALRDAYAGIGAWADEPDDWMAEDIDAFIAGLPDDGSSAGEWEDYGSDNLDLEYLVMAHADFVDQLNLVASTRELLNGQAANETEPDSVGGAQAALNTARTGLRAAEVAVTLARAGVVNATTPEELHFQIGANSNESLMHDFALVNLTITLAQFTVETAGADIIGADGRTITDFIDDIQVEIDAVNLQRATLGALQNRLDYTMRSLDISSENLQDSESRVRNADMAREMMRFTMTNVLQQAATAMLAQANQIPNNLLQILR